MSPNIFESESRARVARGQSVEPSSASKYLWWKSMKIEREGKLKPQPSSLNLPETESQFDKRQYWKVEELCEKCTATFVNNFDLPCWQKIPLKSTLPQSQRGPLSVAIHFPPFWHGLFEAQASEALDLTPWNCLKNKSICSN